jgi:hypothetical protein
MGSHANKRIPDPLDAPAGAAEMTAAAAIIIAAVLYFVVKRSRPVVVNDRQPSMDDRRSRWAAKYFHRPEHMRNPPTRYMPPEGAEDWSAEAVAKRMEDRIAFDERAGVQPLIKPRLPK